VRAATEEFLYELWFIADSTLRPSWRDLAGADFEAWAWRKGLSRRLAELAKKKLIEDLPERTTSARLVRLTESGRRVACGGRDPTKEWARAWDGKWRMFLFDLPFDDQVVRVRLHRLLRQCHFGYLQGSAWLTPHPADRICDMIRSTPVDPESLVLFEGRPISGESDAALVSGAWDFQEINRRYDRYLEILRAAPRNGARGPCHRDAVRVWLHRERVAWREVCQLDPFLPAVLLPADYRGRTAWLTQQATMREMATHLV
jgi:phenylacetic acid degradation operon negative regulatory protein